MASNYDANPDHNINVAAVCGCEVRVYGDMVNGKRPLLRRIDFPNRGAAVLWATEHDEAERGSRSRRQGSRFAVA